MQISLVLAAHDPMGLSQFYAALFGAVVRDGKADHHRILELKDGLKLEIYRPSQHRPFPAAGRALSVCLKLPAHNTPLIELEQHISRAGSKTVAPKWSARLMCCSNSIKGVLCAGSFKHTDNARPAAGKGRCCDGR